MGSYRPERAVADTAVIHLPMQRTARQLSSRNAAHNTPPCPNQRHVSGVGSACRLHRLRAQWSSTWPCSSTAPARLHQLVTWRQRLVVGSGWNRPSATMEQQLANMIAESRRTLQCRPILCRYARTSPLPTTPAPATAQPQSPEAMGSSTCGVTSGAEQRGPLQW